MPHPEDEVGRQLLSAITTFDHYLILMMDVIRETKLKLNPGKKKMLLIRRKLEVGTEAKSTLGGAVLS